MKVPKSRYYDYIMRAIATAVYPDVFSRNAIIITGAGIVMPPYVIGKRAEVGIFVRSIR